MNEQTNPAEVLDEEIKDEPAVLENPPELEAGTDTEAADDPKEAPEEPSGERKKLSRTERMERRYGDVLRRQEDEIKFLRSQLSSEPAAKPTERPKLNDFENVEAYVEAREAFLRKELLAELEAKTDTRARQTSAQSAYEQKVQAAKKELPDWDDVMEDAADEPTTQETIQFCLESDVGPKIAHHLAKHPEENERLNKLSPVRRLAELGKLEEKLSKPAPKVVTKAPGKLSSVSGTGSTAAKDLSTYIPRSYTEWKELDTLRRKK